MDKMTFHVVYLGRRQNHHEFILIHILFNHLIIFAYHWPGALSLLLVTFVRSTSLKSLPFGKCKSEPSRRSTKVS